MENSIDKLDVRDDPIKKMLNDKYTVDYFQREYKWTRKQVEELLDDLRTKFRNYFSSGQKLKDIENYGHYYLGSVILCKKGEKFSIIDGQQRLTTLTLLLIYLYNTQRGLNEDEKPDIANLIRSTNLGELSFNMNVPDREECIKALFRGQEYNNKDANESVKNITDRYEDIESLLSDVPEDEIRFFTEWLINKVIMVKIVAFSDQYAYSIFETMNDRGLNLTSTEMLKGFLLSGISDQKEKDGLNEIWKKNMKKLNDHSEEGDDFFKVFLRAKFAETIRASKKGSSNEDFEKIGTRFHSWVRDNKGPSKVSIEDETGRANLIKDKIPFYTDIYIKIIEAIEKFDEKLPYIYYIKENLAPSLYLPLLLAPIKIEDNDETIDKKLNIVAAFLEMLSVLRSVNRKSNSQTTLRQNLYTLVKDIRDSSVEDLAEIMFSRVDKLDITLDSMDDLILRSKNKSFIKFLLARITAWIEEKCGNSSNFVTYLDKKQQKPFEIEHILPDKFQEHGEFQQKHDFDNYRNRIGALLLIQSGFNQSYNDLPYEQKRKHYYTHNILAKTLCDECYEKDPSFLKFIKDQDLKFEPYKYFKKEQIDKRQSLYKEIAKKIWNKEIFRNLAEEK